MPEPIAPADFYSGLVADAYRHLRSETFDPEPYARFVERSGQPALELGCGDGDPLLDLCERGLDVEGLDSSADMLDRCRVAAANRGLDVTLHHATFESMDLGRRYQSMYFAGATFNLLPDDQLAERALAQIAAHLDDDGSVLVPLFVPDKPVESEIGTSREHPGPNGITYRLTVLGIDRDETTRTQTTALRYERIDGDEHATEDRDWVLHWIEQDAFAAMAKRAGLSVVGVFTEEGAPATTHDTSFTFILRRSQTSTSNASSTP